MSTCIVLAIEYNGAPYRGWQRQKDPVQETVQACLEQALSFVADEPIQVQCAGRTDAGVHATRQIVHFISAKQRPIKAWVQGTNTQLPSSIRVVWAKILVDTTKEDDADKVVEENGEQAGSQSSAKNSQAKASSPQYNHQHIRQNFHARFSATARTYRYIIHNAQVPSALLFEKVTTMRDALDAQAMHEAAQCLLGEQDFSSFRGSGCQSNSPFRFMHFVKVSRLGDFVFVDIKANAFLLHMVRNIVGMLSAIGAGKYPINHMQEVLAAKDRTKADVTAPADGLYLVGVDYPECFGLDDCLALPAIANY